MNQLAAIQVVASADGFNRDYHLVYICVDCINEILNDQDQGSQMDWGLIRVLDEKPWTCAIIDFIETHDHKDY